ncbi:MAG: alanine--tRNA ligase-related protein [Patescibacteria group bacterium]
MNARELIDKYISFFKEHDHTEISGASLVPENDPSALFISAGMHPLVPFLLGEKHPAGKRLVNLQKCIRTSDIERVGNGFHHTFFLMLGNWSLGDPASPDGVGEAGYFKEEAISLSFDFLTSPEWLGLDPERIYVSVFAGDGQVPRDKESIEYWKNEFAQAGLDANIEERIFLFGRKENWWGPVGETGPCGPDTEMFYDTGKEHCGPNCNPSCSCGKYIEIWNNVFMEYKRIRIPRSANRVPQDERQNAQYGKPKAKFEYVPLEQKNVDTGMGVARVTAVTSGYTDDDYKTELFRPIIEKIEDISGAKYSVREAERDTRNTVRSMRIIADHMRAAVFAIADGVFPSNTDRGYVIRRLIRRAVRHGNLLGIEHQFLEGVSDVIIDKYQDLFPGLSEKRKRILEKVSEEEEKFGKALRRGLKQFEQVVEECEGKEEKRISGPDAFYLYQTYGFPLELTVEMAEERGLSVDEVGFSAAYEEHQKKSRAGSEKRFAGGLAGDSEQIVKYHTATHLLQAALRKVLGGHVEQQGSNITEERLRFDFSHPESLSEKEIEQVERLVNEKVAADLPVTMEEMSVEEAEKKGALALFKDKYGDKVKVFIIGEEKDPFSCEVCAGPHMESTGGLGEFEIVKESSVGKGIRRIRAVLH